jgi:hypothetical protein
MNAHRAIRVDGSFAGGFSSHSNPTSREQRREQRIPTGSNGGSNTLTRWWTSTQHHTSSEA